MPEGGGGGGEVLPYISYVPTQGYGLSHFGLTKGIDFDHYMVLNWVWFSREPRVKSV